VGGVKIVWSGLKSGVSFMRGWGKFSKLTSKNNNKNLKKKSFGFLFDLSNIFCFRTVNSAFTKCLPEKVGGGGATKTVKRGAYIFCVPYHPALATLIYTNNFICD
jgi:hypothetical protein